MGAKGKRDVREPRNRFCGTGAAVDEVVSGREQPHLVSCAVEVTRERTRHIGKASGFREWRHLSGEHADR
jgi:hypothetical protein